MHALAQRLDFAESRLRDRLSGLDVESIGVSEYNQRYLGDKIRQLNNSLAVYRHILETSFSNPYAAIQDSVFIDYGGGSGVLSFFAKELGVGTVIYNDIYDVSCRDVAILSRTLGLTMEHIICGDIDAVISYVRERGIKVNVIVSYDVLEHIYDVESHFKQLSVLPSLKLKVVYASGANIRNPRYVHKVKKKQLEAEFIGRKQQWGSKERDTLRAFHDVRRDIIRDYAPELSPEEIEWLAGITRGLIAHDIEKWVDIHRRGEAVVCRPEHPTNTCDPYTGNWEEHLMSPEWLISVLDRAGFLVKIRAGCYSRSGPLHKIVVKEILNVMIQKLGRAGLVFAPYYILYAEKRD